MGERTIACFGWLHGDMCCEDREQRHGHGTNRVALRLWQSPLLGLHVDFAARSSPTSRSNPSDAIQYWGWGR